MAKWIGLAASMACKTTRGKKSRHGAVLICDDEVITMGHNGNTDIHDSDINRHSKHAEEIIMKIPKEVIRKSIMVVVRLCHEGKIMVFKNSEPCSKCRSILLKYRIKRVFYSTDKLGERFGYDPRKKTLLKLKA